MVLFFLIFPGFIERLRILGGSKRGSGCGALKSLKVISTIHRPLCLDFMDGGMGRLVPLETVQINLSYVGTWA